MILFFHRPREDSGSLARWKKILRQYAMEDKKACTSATQTPQRGLNRTCLDNERLSVSRYSSSKISSKPLLWLPYFLCTGRWWLWCSISVTRCPLSNHFEESSAVSTGLPCTRTAREAGDRWRIPSWEAILTCSSQDSGRAEASLTPHWLCSVLWPCSPSLCSTDDVEVAAMLRSAVNGFEETVLPS